MQQELTQYFRCPDKFFDFELAEGLSRDSGYFRFGQDAICYGRSAAGSRAKSACGSLHDISGDVRFHDSAAVLPFDPAEVATNLRYERYVAGSASGALKFLSSLKRNAYYRARPLLPVAFRKHLQKIHLKGWREVTFPRWPVDTTVDNLMENLLALAIKCRGGKSIPFIWFWPDGMNACAIMTHDVEEPEGVAYCSRLMDINDSFSIPASFQIVPEKRYPVTERYLESIRGRGFEVGVQDLNHDGRLYWDRREFNRRAAIINRYGREWGAVGFRAGILYRNQEWFDALDFKFDMSVPNVAHLDPQHGGCCTVMPYFVGKILELPVTATQDYSLFHILNEYSLSLWEEQIDVILHKHGLLNMIVHPDYLTGQKEEETYTGLLGLYDRLRRQQNVWIPLPKDANTWWRQRSQMRLVHPNGEWRIEGPGQERAVVAFASLEDDNLTYSVMQPSGQVLRRPVSHCVPAGVV
jgi:hypothetical protein